MLFSVQIHHLCEIDFVANESVAEFADSILHVDFHSRFRTEWQTNKTSKNQE